MRNKKLAVSVIGLMALFSIALITSVFAVIGEPLEQIVPQQTVDAAVAELFGQTATVQAQIYATHTIQGAFNAALTATAQPQGTIQPRATMTPQLTPTSRLFAEMTAISNPQTPVPVAPEIDFSTIPQERQSDGGFVIGLPFAPVTLIQFGDFACPHCQDYQPVIDQFIADFVVTGQAKFEYRIFPTAGGELSVFTGYLLECAEVQRPGAFWEGYQLMLGYAENGQYTPTVGETFAADADLSYEDMLDCARGGQQVNTDVSFGYNLGVSGTPALRIRYGDSDPIVIVSEGREYTGGGVPYEVLEAIVASMQPDVN